MDGGEDSRTPEERYEAFQAIKEELPEDRKAQWEAIGKEAESPQASPERIQSQTEAFIASLPDGLQQQFRNGLVDMSNMPIYDLQRLAAGASLDADTGLVFANRENSANPGNTGATLNDARDQATTGVGDGLETSSHSNAELGDLSPVPVGTGGGNTQREL